LGMLRTLIVVSLCLLTGCQSAKTTEIRREPAKVRFLEIDTRPAPVPQASRQGTLDNCHPIARALVLASIASMEPPKPQPIVVDPDGRVTLPSDFTGVLRLGDAEGEKPQTRTPDGGGSWSTALTFVSNTTKVPPKGAALLLIGALLIAGGAAAWFLGAGLRLALTLAIAGGVLVGIGYMLDSSPWLIWLSIAALVGVVAFQVIDGRKGQDRREAVETIVPVVESIPDILTRNMVAAFPDLDGAKVAETVKRAASEVKTRIRKGAESGKVAARVVRAVDDAKAAMGTATTFRGS